MCCPSEKHNFDDCCELDKARNEEFVNAAKVVADLRREVQVWREKVAVLEERAGVLVAEAKRLSEQLARTYE